MYDIIIIGGGPAGLTAAIYGARAGKKVLLLEGNQYGGQIIKTNDVENYPGLEHTTGSDYAFTLLSQAKSFGAECVQKAVTGVEIIGDGSVKKVLTDSESYEAKTVIIATGSKNKPLGLKGEVEWIGKGVSYCATCDGMFYRGQDVAIATGGRNSLEDALFLSNYCNKVYVIHRADVYPGDEELFESMKKKENVEFILHSKVSSLGGDDELKSVVVEDVKTKESREINVSGLFITIGHEPDSVKFKNVVDIDNQGYILSGEDCLGKVPGVFVAGDCRQKKVRQLTTAASDGTVAALAAVEYLK
ncbi:MAG: FAD-dependent oxidoreductase [Eubacterium sp.]|nr:FAD-dependent oxidoreductase [Eubacterium sp.]